MNVRRILRPAASMLLVLALTVTLAQAQRLKVEVQKAVKHDVSKPLRDITPVLIQGERNENKRPRPVPQAPQAGADSVVQSSMGPSAATSITGFEGVGLGNYSVNSAPPDTTGAAGATQYVQAVNSAFAVFNKSTGAIVYGPANVNTLFAGFGGRCQTDNDGDPIVQYDKAANRWIVSQFAVSATPYTQCVAVSTTSDATGTWNRYAFTYNQFNDYPKIGVWPDGYYVSYNMFTSSFQGSRVCALDRSAMLAGTAATQQCFQLSNSFGGLLPSDLDGSTAPPAGSPNYFLNFGSSSLRLWKFSVNWTNPLASTFTGPTSIPVASFATACGGGTCIPQPGTPQKLDSLADRLMYRLAYRNLGGTEILLVNHSVDLGAKGKNPTIGARWYELRKNTSGNFVVRQQGTYAPTNASRWMGSIAMDKNGNIALGYSLSSTSIYPSIRFTSRNAADALGTMGIEENILTGSGAQIKDFYNLTRWGDYSHMSVDPVDDCTMYYTTEYLASNGTFNWHTYVGRIKLAGCQ
jgi:hypothetical protein